MSLIQQERMKERKEKWVLFNKNEKNWKLNKSVNAVFRSLDPSMAPR
jgi:hypothetical protein